MTIRDYLGIVRQRLLLSAIVVALTTASAVILSLRQPPEFTVHSRLQVVPIGIGSGVGHELNTKLGFTSGVLTEAEYLKSELVANRVIERLHLKMTPQDAIKHLLVNQLPATDVLVIEVRASQPTLAVALANVFPQEYIKLRREQAVDEATDQTKLYSERITKQSKRYGELDAALRAADPNSPQYALIAGEHLRVGSLLGSLEATRQNLIDQIGLKERGAGKVLAQASVPEGESTSNPVRTGVLGFIIGLPLAMGLALLLDSMTNTVRSQEEAEKIVGAETLGLIPFSPRQNPGYVISREEPYSSVAEAFRTLRINLESTSTSEKRRFLFTSPGAGEGKTTTIANLGVAFAEAGRSALLVSADLRRPRLHHYFGAEAAPGLSDVLRDEVEAADVTTEVGPNLYLLPSGAAEPRPDVLVHTTDVAQTFELLAVRRSSATRPRNQENGTASGNGRKRVSKVVGVQPQTILVDSPPVLGAAEVSTLAAAVDGVVLVLQMGVTGREAAARASEQIRRSGGKIVGMVLVGVRSDRDYTLYESEIELKDGDSTWSKVVSSLQK